MKKGNSVLVRIATLRRQREEANVYAVQSRIDAIEAEHIAVLREIERQTVSVETDIHLIKPAEYYGRSLGIRAEGLRRDRESLLPDLQSARMKLRRAIFSEQQIPIES